MVEYTMKLEPFEETFQQTEDSCYSATIKVVLDKLSIAHRKPALKISVRTINNLCGYKNGFAVMGDGVVGLDRLYAKCLRKNGYTIKRGGSMNIDIDGLRKIINNNEDVQVFHL